MCRTNGSELVRSVAEIKIVSNVCNVCSIYVIIISIVHVHISKYVIPYYCSSAITSRNVCMRSG